MTLQSENHNPYSPPAATVADMGGPQAAERPPSVVYAVRILWASFALGTLMSIVELLLPNPAFPESTSLVSTVIWTVVGFAITYWLLTAAWRGRSWSRILQVVLFVLGVGVFYMAWSFEPTIFQMPTYMWVETVVSTAMNIIGTAMFFTPGANAWYRAMRAAR